MKLYKDIWRWFIKMNIILKFWESTNTYKNAYYITQYLMWILSIHIYKFNIIHIYNSIFLIFFVFSKNLLKIQLFKYLI